jgi:tRNA(Arg) A34 adenosine deaminase TadA
MEYDPKRIRKLSKTKKRYFDLAKRAAMESSYGKLRHGAVIVKGGSVVSFGFNKSNHCQFGQRFRHMDKGPATQHAEISAILGLPRSATQGADVYVVRINNDCDWRMSKPCPMCEQALRFVGVKRVFYTTGDKHYDYHRV